MYFFIYITGIPENKILYYGIHVADVSGFPPVIVKQARNISATLSQQAKERKDQHLQNEEAVAERTIVDLKGKLLALKLSSLPLASVRVYLKDLAGQYKTCSRVNMV